MIRGKKDLKNGANKEEGVGERKRRGERRGRPILIFFSPRERKERGKKGGKGGRRCLAAHHAPLSIISTSSVIRAKEKKGGGRETRESGPNNISVSRT